MNDNPRYNRGAGWCDGELVERLHASLRFLAYATKRMRPARRHDQLTVFICLRNLTLDAGKVLYQKHHTLCKRELKARLKLGRKTFDPKGLEIDGQAVDPQGLALDRSTDDPATLEDEARAVLEQARAAIKPLEKDVQRQFDLIFYQHEADILASELAEYETMEAAARALLFKEEKDKQSRREKLLSKIKTLKNGLQRADLSAVVLQQLEDPAGQRTVLAQAVIGSVQRIEAQKRLFAAARRSTGAQGPNDEAKLRTGVRRRLARQRKELVAEVGQLNALLKPLKDLAAGAEATVLSKPVDITWVNDQELWHAPLLEELRTIVPELGVPGAEAAQAGAPRLTQARLCAMDAVFDCLRVREELATWGYEVLALGRQHYVKCGSQLDAAIALLSGEGPNAVRGLHPLSAPAEKCNGPAHCKEAKHGRFECALSRGNRGFWSPAHGLASALAATAMQHFCAACEVLQGLWNETAVKDHTISRDFASFQTFFPLLLESRRQAEEKWHTYKSISSALDYSTLPAVGQWLQTPVYNPH